MLRAYVADPARDHNGLVVATDLVVRQPWQPALVGAEVARQVRPPILIVESRSANRTIDHDFQRRRHTLRMGKIVFPGLRVTGYAQMRDCVSGQARLGFGTQARCTFIPNLTAGTCCRAGKRRNRRRMIVSFHLHHNVYRLIDVGKFTVTGTRHEPRAMPAFDHCGVIAVS